MSLHVIKTCSLFLSNIIVVAQVIFISKPSLSLIGYMCDLVFEVQYTCFIGSTTISCCIVLVHHAGTFIADKGFLFVLK